MFVFHSLPSLFLRIGIAFVFVYAAISMSLSPQTYAHYLPLLIRQNFPVDWSLHFFGGFEILLSIWLLTGKKNLYPAAISAITLTALTAVNLDSFNILFRNIAAIFAALALVFLDLEKKK